MKTCLMILALICSLINTSAHALQPNSSSQQMSLNFQIIKEQLILTKQSFKSVQLEKHANGEFIILVELTAKAAKQMQHFTATNINRQANMVWQGHIVTAPTIKSPLSAKFQISGFSEQQAKHFVKEMQMR